MLHLISRKPLIEYTEGLSSRTQKLRHYRGEFIDVLVNYIHRRRPSVSKNGKRSSRALKRARIPKGSGFTPLVRNFYFKSVLHLIPQATAHAEH